MRLIINCLTSILFTISVLFASNTAIPAIELEPVFSSVSFDSPVFLTHAGDSTNRIFIVEKKGIIKVFPNQENISQAKIFLDISDKVNSGKSESGLLGLAFHPDYKKMACFMCITITVISIPELPNLV